MSRARVPLTGRGAPTGTPTAAVSRRTLLAGLLAAGAAAPAGCAALPTSGEVSSSDAVQGAGGQVVQTASRPRDGAGPEEVVSGFLRACVAGFSDDFATARTFLHRVASETWDPTAVVHAYAGASAPVVERESSGAVRVTVELVSSIDASGALISAGSKGTGGEDDYWMSYSLATDAAGQWRIVDLPSGVLMPSGSLSTNFVATSLYFLTPDLARFVPELRWLPRRNLSASVVSALLEGPAQWLAPGAVTAFPANVALATDGVVVEGETVTVGLDATAGEIDSRSRSLLAAQLTTTLVQVEGISTVVVKVGSDTITDPAPLPAPDTGGGAVLGVSAGAVVQGTSPTRTTLAAAQALGTGQARHPALGPDGVVYALNASSLLRLRPGESAASVISSVGEADAGEGGLLPPVADRHGWVWTAADGALLAVGDMGQHARLDVPWLAGRRIVGLDVSAESARLALRHHDGGGGGERVSVAVVVRDADGTPTSLGDPVVLPQATGTGVTGLAWCDPVSVAALGPGHLDSSGSDDRDTGEVRHVQVGGMMTSVAGVRGTTAMTSDRVSGTALLTDDQGQVWQRRGATWRVLTSEITDPSYPLP